MPENIKDLFAEAEKVAKTLNERSNRIQSAIQEMEQKLQTLNLGLEYWLDEDPLSNEGSEVDEEDSRDSPTRVQRELGYAKIAGSWGLFIRRARYEEHNNGYTSPWWELTESSEIQPLQKASRQLRIRALDRFPGLIRALTQEAENAISTIEQATTLAEVGPQ
jgi:hypothetical protein